VYVLHPKAREIAKAYPIDPIELGGFLLSIVHLTVVLLLWGIGHFIFGWTTGSNYDNSSSIKRFVVGFVSASVINYNIADTWTDIRRGAFHLPYFVHHSIVIAGASAVFLGRCFYCLCWPFVLIEASSVTWVAYELRFRGFGTSFLKGRPGLFACVRGYEKWLYRPLYSFFRIWGTWVYAQTWQAEYAHLNGQVPLAGWVLGACGVLIGLFNIGAIKLTAFGDTRVHPDDVASKKAN